VEIIETPKPGPLHEADIAEALADANARRVLAACVRKARAVKDITQETGVPIATVYRVVHRLVEQGLLVVERSALTEDGKRYELYRSRIRSSRIEFDAAGERVTWEANEPVEERLTSMWGTLRGQAGKP
jgi:predicted transcriptional regulator